jgi:chloride channel 3/4/5
MNNYPFLDNKGSHPTTDQTLGDLSRSTGRHRTIDISSSALVRAKDLRGKLDYLLMAGELDSGLPIVRDTVLVGMIAATDLEFALDGLEDGYAEFCIMSPDHQNWPEPYTEDGDTNGPVHDFTIYIDPVCPFPQNFCLIRIELTKYTVPRCPRRAFTIRLGLSVLCQTWTSIRVRFA